jgi:hypothetical protein
MELFDIVKIVDRTLPATFGHFGERSHLRLIRLTARVVASEPSSAADLPRPH